MTQNSNHVWIIAEAGVNHNGSVERALEMIDCAASAGADAVKFQTFRAIALASANAPKADYQLDHTDRTESQLEMLRKLELDADAHRRLLARCTAKKIEFLSTPFDHQSLVLLTETLGIGRLKLPSGEITNGPLLLAAASTNLPIILSTGMAGMDEITDALGALAFGYLHKKKRPSLAAFRAIMKSEAARAVLREKVVLLHCTSGYPTPCKDINLRAMDTLADTFGLSVGLSDHSQGIAVPIAAAARGATVIEKHFTLDRTLAGPDHQASLDPDELRSMITAIRQVEQALGSPVKQPVFSELETRRVVRKSLVTTRPLVRGECIDAQALTYLRPGNGISPMRYWDYVGSHARRNYAAGEQLADDEDS